MKAEIGRWYRKFNLDVDKETVKNAVAMTTDPEKYTKISLAGPYTPEDVTDLNGKIFKFKGEGREFTFDFGKEPHDVFFKEDDEEAVNCYCNVKSLDHEVFFVNFLVPGNEFARQITLVPDMTTGYATIVDAHFGTENSNIDVSREFIFGRLEGNFKDGEGHGFTNELVGKAIEWDYGPHIMNIRHMYTSNLYYTYGAMAPKGAWMATNPADYVKIRDNIFLFSFVEERQAGLQGLFLIDLDKVHDIGSFFGVSADHVSSACVGAKGTLSDITFIFEK